MALLNRLCSRFGARARVARRGRRVGLIGLGAAARSIHVPALAAVPGVVLVAGADPDPEARRAFARLAPGTRTWVDAAELLGREQLDWVVIAAPPASHRDLCDSALEAGCHVLCEKPFAESSADAELMARAAERHGRSLIVNHEFPYMPIFRVAQSLRDDDGLGRIVFAQFWELLREVPSEQPGWRARSLTLREFGTHVLNLAVGLFGDMPDLVHASMASPGGPPGTDLVDVVTLQFPGGRLASIVLNRVCHGPTRYLEMRADGTHASLRASFGGRASFEVGIDPASRRPKWGLDLAAGGQAWLEQGGRRRVVARNGLRPFADATARLLEAAMVAVEAGRPPTPDARHACRIVRLVETVYESARSGEAVRLREINDGR